MKTWKMRYYRSIKNQNKKSKNLLFWHFFQKMLILVGFWLNKHILVKSKIKKIASVDSAKDSIQIKTYDRTYSVFMNWQRKQRQKFLTKNLKIYSYTLGHLKLSRVFYIILAQVFYCKSLGA